MRFIIGIICTLFFISPSCAQKKADSLREIWYNEKCDVVNRLRAVDILIDDYYLERKTDSALILSANMLSYAQEKKNLKYEIEAHTLIGEIYFEKEENTEGDNPPIGIVLSRSKDELLVKYAMNNVNSQLFVSKYQLYLPNREELKALIEKQLD